MRKKMKKYSLMEKVKKLNGAEREEKFTKERN